MPSPAVVSAAAAARPVRIVKPAARVVPHWHDDAAQRASFSWEAMRLALAGMPDGVLNIGFAAVDRHGRGERGEHVAIHWLGAAGAERRITYRELMLLTNRFANAITKAGLQRGDRLFVLMPRLPQLYVAVLGALKAGVVVSPLFSAFGPEPIATRLNLGAGRAPVTTDALYRRKVAPVRERMPTLQHVFLVREDPGGPTEAGSARTTEPLPAGTLDLDALLREACDSFEALATRPDDAALLHFTSGTTGQPKGAMHVHDAALTHYATGLYALDLHADDVFWCTADPGWVTGMSYGIIAPLLHGVTLIVDEAEFDPQRWYRILQDQAVSVWYTAPTAIRMLMKAGAELAARFTFPRLRFIASVGEPLNPQAVWWGQDVFGLAVHDNWWQTETGGIMIANAPAFDVKPGSMGRPLPGVDACVVERLEGGAVRVIDVPGVEGELALRRGWPSMFRG